MTSRTALYHIRRSLFLQLALLVLLALGSGLGLSACSGDGGGNSASNTFRSIWTGTATPSGGAAGDTSRLDFEFFQSGNTLTGEAIITNKSVPQFGSLAGTVSGSNFSFTASIGTSGSTIITGSINGSSTALTGTYQTTPGGGANSNGTFSVTKSVGLTTPIISKNLAGTSTVTGSAAKSLALVVTQTQDVFTLTGTSGNNTASPRSLTGSGAIVGNHLAASITDSNSNATVIDGTVSGTTISGTTLKPDGNGGAATNGTFTLAPGG